MEIGTALFDLSLQKAAAGMFLGVSHSKCVTVQF